MVLQPGDVVDVRFTKWGGGRHWEFPVTVLGTDDHGVWAGAGVGTRLWRPAASFVSEFDWVTLVPHEAAWAASFYDAEDHPTSVYVDMTTPAVWSGNSVSMVDLDLDVIVRRDGTLLLDDEDEFALHQVELGYPPRDRDHGTHGCRRGARRGGGARRTVRHRGPGLGRALAAPPGRAVTRLNS